jgi:hypothetical protein
MADKAPTVDQAIIDAILSALSPSERDLVRAATVNAADAMSHRFHAHRAPIELHLRPSFDAITAYMIAGWVGGLRAELKTENQLQTEGQTQ